jgi:MFS family permease
MGFAWTLIEVFNPEHQSGTLAVIGFRAYWLWWLAPALVAQVLRDEKERRRAIYFLLATSTVVAAFAAVQFVLPAEATVYTYIDGEKVEQATVSSTGRARVASTFSFLSGFSDFTILIPTLMLSLGLDSKEPLQRRAAFIVTGLTAATIPMAGSRFTVLVGAGILLISFWSSGLFFTRIGRRLLVGGVTAAVISVVAFPEALLGVESRFADEEETHRRYMLTAASVLPPLAIAMVDHPALGIGTGMLQNARIPMKINVSHEVEHEFERHLVELGTFGFLIVWTLKFGLSVALFRAHKFLKRAGRRGASTAALSYAILTMVGSLTFDHVWQALYFIGCGFILAEVFAVIRARALAAAPIAQAPAQALPAATMALP